MMMILCEDELLSRLINCLLLLLLLALNFICVFYWGLVDCRWNILRFWFHSIFEFIFNILISQYLNIYKPLGIRQMQQLTKTKDLGNELFKQKKYEEAILQFHTVITKLQEDNTKQYLSAETESSKLYVIALLNSAFASINSKTLQHYERAIQNCTKALAIDTKNIKGLYRRGLAKKEKAQFLEIQAAESMQQPDYSSLLDIYESAKSDFENLCIIDKQNDLAKKNLSQIIKNIYRVTVAKGQQVDLTTKKQQSVAPTAPIKSPYEIPVDAPKKKQQDMTKIMKEYKVEEVTHMVQDKVYSKYLEGDLPALRSDLEKAIREIKKSDEVFIEFIYRMDEQYLKKIQPTFDLLGILIKMILQRGQGEKAKKCLSAIKVQKSFRLYWKSLTKKEKEEFKDKWVSLGLEEGELN